MIIRTSKITKQCMLLICLFFYSLSNLAYEATSCNDKTILGNFEQVMVVENGIIIDAKMDTGASMSSLSASNIKEVRRANKKWIEFDLNIPHTSQKITLYKPLVGYIKIVKRTEEVLDNKQAYSLRPIVFLHLCIANKNKLIEVNLIDRTPFKYPMLIGSKALKQFNIIIDASKKFVSQPQCTTEVNAKKDLSREPS